MFDDFNLLDFIIQTYYIILPIICTAAVRKVSKSLEAQEQKASALEKKRSEELEEANKRREANAEGTKLILFYMMQRLHTEYMYQGYVTHEQRVQFEELYKSYHTLGGNGYGTAMWEEIEGLEIRNDKSSVSPFIQMLKDINKESD